MGIEILPSKNPNKPNYSDKLKRWKVSKKRKAPRKRV